jgi:LysR family transcriptional regulator of beta-lactamase
LSTNNNRVDVAAEGLDYAIRFGAGAWHGIEALRLIDAPLSVLCVPEIARQLHAPSDLLQQTLLRSYRTDEWSQWFQAAGLSAPVAPPRSIVFDSSLAMMEAALQGVGVALAPLMMFARQLAEQKIHQPFAIGITTGSYWLTRLQSRPETAAMTAFRSWLVDAAQSQALRDV